MKTTLRMTTKKSRKISVTAKSESNPERELKPDLWPVYGSIKADTWSCMTIH